jgi:hypothetical protein
MCGKIWGTIYKYQNMKNVHINTRLELSYIYRRAYCHNTVVVTVKRR